MKAIYSLKADLPDPRDYRYVSKGQGLPQAVDLRPWCSKVEDQKLIGSCTANALVGDLEFLENRKKEGFVDLSRLFVYYNERFIEDRVLQDSGATLRDGIKALKKYGVCSERIWPYEDTLLFKRPSEAAYQEALEYKIEEYERLHGFIDMKDCLARGLPFAFGVAVYESFESPEVESTGVIPIPARNERLLGGHALLAVGYDDIKGMLLFRNSWGQRWGERGYGRLPYEYMEGGRTFDYWKISR